MVLLISHEICSQLITGGRNLIRGIFSSLSGLLRLDNPEALMYHCPVGCLVTNVPVNDKIS